jgi:N-acetylglucosaminyldiphosphoundecaprenol N-acetyl-beta-D-mannosaminyltransferase
MSSAVASPPRAQVLGCELDRLDMEATVAVCERVIDNRGFAQHVAINAAKVVALQEDPVLNEVVSDCELITADGQAVVWASRIIGDPVPARVAGIDLMLRLLARAEEKGYRVYVLGAQPEILARAMVELRGRHPQLRLAGFRDGYFSDDEAAEVADGIARAQPDILLVAISSPRKEYFLARYGRSLEVPFIMGVGGAIDIVAGVTRRAPVAMRRLGLEWLFRLLQEPRRLLHRYTIVNARFIVLTLREAARRRLRAMARS